MSESPLCLSDCAGRHSKLSHKGSYWCVILVVLDCNPCRLQVSPLTTIDDSDPSQMHNYRKTVKKRWAGEKCNCNCCTARVCRSCQRRTLKVTELLKRCQRWWAKVSPLPLTLKVKQRHVCWKQMWLESSGYLKLHDLRNAHGWGQTLLMTAWVDPSCQYTIISPHPL